MIVLFEGVDGGGKTTLIKRLLKTFPDAEEIEWPGRRNDPNEFVKSCKEFLESIKDKENDGKLYFLDRCGIGEFLYGPITPGRKMAKTSEYAEVFKKWLKGKLLIICINQDAHKLAIERGEDGPAKDKTFHNYVSAGYRALANGSGLHIIGYNFKNDPQAYDNIVGTILAHRVIEVLQYDNSK